MRVRCYVFRGQLFRTGNAQRARINLFNTDTNLAKLFDYGVKVQWLTVFYFEIALRDGCRRDESSRFDAIWNDRVLSAAQFFDAFDLNPAGSGASHSRSHLVEQFRQVGDLRLTSGVLQDRDASGQRGSHHHVFRASDGDLVELNFASYQSSALRRARDHVTAFKLNLGSQFFELHQMKVYRPRP